MIEEKVLKDCLAFEDRLNDRIDNRQTLIDDPALAAHAQECPLCSRLLKDYQQILDVQDVQPQLVIEEDFLFSASHFNLAQRQQKRKSCSWQMRRSKLKWVASLAPSLAALLIVAISMLKGSGHPEFFVSDALWNGSGLQNVVTQSSLAGVSLPESGRSQPRSAYAYDPIVNAVFIESGVVEGVQGCSGALYHLANAQSRFRACNWSADVVAKVTSPYEPFHSEVPYRGEFSSIPKFRFLLGFTLRLVELTFSGELDLSQPDLGFQAEQWRLASMA